MRRWLRVVAVVLALLCIVAVYVRLFAGGPVRFVPGGWLRGELVETPVADWSFAREHQSVHVESRARWLPYSTGTWFVAHDGDLFLVLPALFGDGLKLRIDEDPQVWVRFDEEIYPQVAVPFDDEARYADLLAPFLRRLMAVEIGGEVRRVESALGADVWIYRLRNP